MPTISVHVDDEVYQQVGALAEQMDRSKSWVVSDALEPYLEHRRWMIERTAASMEELQAGRLKTVSHDDAVAGLMAYARKLDAGRKKD